MDSNPGTRRVSFHTERAAQPSASFRASVSSSNTISTNPPSSSIRTLSPSRARTSSNLGGLKLRPLTQLKATPEQLSSAGIESCVIQKGVLSRKFSQGAGATIPEQLYQSEHSRRGSVTAHSTTSNINNSCANPYGLSTSQASLPKLTLGNRIRSSEHVDQVTSEPKGPHPYAVILPGEESRRIPVKSRTMSAFAHSSVGLTRSGGSPNRNKSLPPGARRFTQTANTAVHLGGGSPSVTANQAAALHARRYSSIAREPSAATILHDSSTAAEVFTHDANLSEAQKLTRVDTKMLLVSFNSLIGKDGGGDAIRRLLTFVFHGGLGKAQDEATTLLNQVLRNIPTLHAAYVTVHFHEIIEQLQKIGSLLFAEPEVVLLIDQFSQPLRGFASSNAVPPPSVSFLQVYELVLDKLTTSPIYRSALLKLVETICKLILASESLRDRLWTTFSQALSLAQRSQTNAQTANISNFLGLVFSIVEQLTGGPVKPLVKHFISWIALVDDLLTKLASETCEFLSQPFPVPIIPPGDYTTHPLGYIYSPTETAARMDIVVQKWLSVFTQDQGHKEAFEQFKKVLDNVVSGIIGNSTFTRFSRDLARVWSGILGDPSAGVVGTGIQGGLECVKTLAAEFLQISVGDLKLRCSSADVVLNEVKLSVVDALPSELSFSTHSKLFPVDFRFQSSTRLEMKDLQLCSKAVKIAFSAAGTSEPNGTGLVDLAFKVDLRIDFIPKNNKLLQMLVALPFYGGAEVKVSSSEVTFATTAEATVHDEFSAHLKSELTSQIEEAVRARVDSFFKTWLAIPPPSSRPVASRHSSTVETTRRVELPLRQSLLVPETHGNARDRFKASVRDLTGIKPAAVLMQLQNPLSGPGSPVATPLQEETLDSRRKRRQSMAEYLTDISKADSTLPENIQRPPVADSRHAKTDSLHLPNVFDDEEEELPVEYGTMAKSLSFSARGDTTSVEKILRPIVSNKADFNSVFSHRGGMPNFPTGEMSYEAYEMAEASMDEQAGPGNGQQDIPPMAKSLSELATRDTTTEEAIAHPPSVDVSSTEPGFAGMNENMTMDRVTRHLSGLTDLPEEAFNSLSGQSRIIRGATQPPELADKLVMADLLTDVAMEDNTLPETQATGRLSGPIKAVGVPTGPSVTSLKSEEILKMRTRLSKEATIDTTLPENIAVPPGTRPAYRAPGTNSFTSLKVVRSMSTTLNDVIERDYTTPEGQLEMSKTHQSGEQVVGLTEKEMKQRRQSFKLTEQAMRDTTLLESIRSPVVVGSEAVVSTISEGQEAEGMTK